MFKQFKGTILILISALMFGSYGVFAKYLGNYDIFYQTYVRCFIVAFFFLVLGLIKKDFRKIEREDYKWFAVVLLFTIFTIAPIVYAFNKIAIGTASFLFYASFTICTYIFGFIFFKEKCTSVKVAALALASLGLLLIFRVQLTAAFILPAVMASLNGLASSGEVTFSKKISNKYSINMISFWVFIVIAITHLIISLAIGEYQDLRLITTSGVTLLAFSLAAIIGMFTVIEGFKYVEPSIGAIIGLMEIVFSLLFGIVLFKETLSIPILMGGLLIIIAGGLPNFLDIIKAKKI